MALTEDSNLVMPVAPAYGGGNSAFGGDWAWIILLLLLGWGNNGGFGGNGNGGLYPWMNNADALASGFAGVTAAVNGAQTAVTSQMYANTIADLERSYAAQTASAQSMSALQSQLAQCCCDNRLATANLQSVIAQENCADREALNYAARDIIAGQNAGIQRILDQMCQDKIDAKNEKIADLERQLAMATLAASQGEQTARVLADNAAQTAALEQYLAPVPRPAYVVANPNGCNCNGYSCVA